MNWLDELWLYGGWFYFSLIIGIGLVYWLPAYRRQLKFLILMGALGVAGFYYGQKLTYLPEAIDLLTEPDSRKKEVTTLGQVPFLEKVNQVLSPSASGCLIESWDVPTHFLKQRLYPRRFKVIGEEDSFEGCDYVISQYEVRELPGYYPIVVVKENVLYKKQS